MSARRLVLRFSEDADRDIEDILLYTRRTWGENQQSSYQQIMTRSFRRLRSFPDLGQQRRELFYGCRSIQVEQHVIYYYQPSATELVVIRILHVRQDAINVVLPPVL